MALGDGTTPGVNQKLLPWLQANKGKRFGIISAFGRPLMYLLSELTNCQCSTFSMRYLDWWRRSLGSESDLSLDNSG
jgi:hypothetical protein